MHLSALREISEGTEVEIPPAPTIYTAIQISRRARVPLFSGSVLDGDIDIINQFMECLELESEYGPRQTVSDKDIIEPQV